MAGLTEDLNASLVSGLAEPLTGPVDGIPVNALVDASGEGLVDASGEYLVDG